MYTYTVTFYTGSLSWAGTNANVNLILCGTEGESREHVFKNDLETTFKSGAKDVFTVETEKCLGKLQKIRVGHDNKGPLPGWKLLKVDVLDDTTGKGIEFECYKWFDLESGDGRIQRDLYPSGDFRAKTYMYRIFFQTGEEWMSGTDANIFITLYGTKGETEEIKLENQGTSTFESGMINTYTIERKTPLGTLTKVRVGHDNTGLGPGWFLEQVRVEDTVNDQTVAFPCGRWLATDADDGMIVRQLVGDDFEKRDEEAKKREKEQQEEEERKRREEEERRMKEEEDRKRREREQLEKFENEKKRHEEERKRRIEENRKMREKRELRRSREILHDIDETEQERKRRESEERKKREEERKRKGDELVRKKSEERRLKRLSDQATLEELKMRHVEEYENQPHCPLTTSQYEEQLQSSNYEEQRQREDENRKKDEEKRRREEEEEKIRQEKEKRRLEELEKMKREEEIKLQEQKEQQEKRRSLLFEEMERKMRTYKVDLFTEDQFGACTGVNILLTLYGSEGQSDEHCIESEGEHTFKEGMRGSLEVECPHHLGTLTHIRIGPDHSTGWASPWFLVTVKDPKTDNVVVFTCNRLQDSENSDSPHIYYPSNINDVEELLALESETSVDWKKVKKTKKAQIWRKKVSVLEEIPPITRAELQLRGIPYKKAVKYFTDWKIRAKWDKTYSTVDIIETIGNFKVIYCSNKMPAFCKNREMVLACLDHYDQWYHTQIMCSISHPSVPHDPKTKQIRASSNMFGILIRPVGDGTQSSKVTVITQVDLKGTAPRFVKKGYLTNSPIKWTKMMKRYYKKHRDKEEISSEKTENGEKPNSDSYNNGNEVKV